MIRSFIYRILEKRHFWRYATFGEIADLYAAQTLRMAAISLVSGFSSVFLYKQGYSVAFIMGFWGIYFFSKIFIAPISGMITSWLGTTSSTMISNILYIPALIALSFVPQEKMLALVIYGVCLSISVTLHELCYLIDFSRVKSIEHAGKEIGFMNILEKIVIAISPVIGGVIALQFNVQITMWIAGVLIAFAGIPLYKLKNQSEKHHRFIISGFPWKLAISSLFTECAIGFDIIASSSVWGLFVAIILLPKAGNGIYATLGLLSSVTLLVAIITSALFGKLIDGSKGGLLLKVGVGINVIVHLFRALVSSVAGAVGINVSNEVASTAQGMTFMRGVFDIADTSGYRTTYIVCIEAIKNLGSTIACFTMMLCAMYFSGKASFQVYYVITALVCSTVFFCRFKIYRK